MIRRIISVATLLLIATAASAQTTVTGSKGYELHSWKINNHWYYSLLPRTDKTKTYEEITAKSQAHRDTSGLTSALKKLPRGEEVYWMGDAPIAAKSVTAAGLSLKHPSRKRIKHIKSICDQLGIKLTLA